MRDKILGMYWSNNEFVIPLTIRLFIIFFCIILTVLILPVLAIVYIFIFFFYYSYIIYLNQKDHKNEHRKT